MTEIEQKALALVNEVRGDDFKSIGEHGWGTIHLALCRAIEQHEAFRRDVSDHMSDVVNKSRSGKYYTADALGEDLRRFIIPKPVDPLVEALQVWGECEYGPVEAEALRAAMKARGLKIVEIDQ